MEEQSEWIRMSGFRWRASLGAVVAALCLFAALTTSPAQAAPPANDDFASAQVLSGQPITATGTTKQATIQSGEPDHAENGTDASVWYQWTPSQTGMAEIDACDDNDRVNALAVYSGNSLASLTELDSGYCRTVVQVTSGETYRIAVGSYSDWTGAFPLSINVFDPPANDDFEAAEELTGGSVDGTTLGASLQPGEPDHIEDGGDSSVWYRWTAPESGTASLSGCDYDDEDYYVGGLAVYTGGAIDSLNKVGEGYCAASFQAEEGTTYYIAVVGWSQYGGPFTLSAEIVHPPANDDFAAAETVTATSVNGTTAGATRQAGEPGHGDSSAGATVWYSWTPSQSGTASVNACSTGVIDAVAAYTGNTLTGLSRKAVGYCSLTFQATAGTTYRLALASYAGYWGQFKLDLQVANPPANDNFASSIAVSALPVNGTTLAATSEAGEPNHYDSDATASVWYRIAFQSSATYVFDVCNEQDTVGAIAIYQGTTLNSLNLIGEGYCKAYVDLAANTTYRVAIASYPGDWGDFSLKVSYYQRPANDDFAAAATISGVSTSVSGSSYSATKQSGEPAHGGGYGANSTWYSWTAPSDGNTTFTVCSSFDPVLAAYTGSAVNALTEVASDEATFPDRCDDYGSDIRFRASAGTTYKIAVDGYEPGERGPFRIYVDHVPTVSLTVTPQGDGAGDVRSDLDGIDCGPSCSSSYEVGEVVTLTATPASGSTFEGWGGACSGKGACAVAMNEAKSVTARFDRIPPPPVKHDLTVTVAGDGAGRVTGNPGGIDCDRLCVSGQDEGTKITLSAVPVSGSEFVGWSGACSGSAGCAIDLNADVGVTATFRKVVKPQGTPSLASTVTPRNIKLKAGKGGAIKVSIKNVGNGDATGLSICAQLPAKLKKTIKVSACRKSANLAAGGSYATSIPVKTTAKAKGKARVQVVVSAVGVAAKSFPVTVTVKAKPKKKRH